MKTIVIDVSNEPKKGRLPQVAKLFLSKNKVTSLILVGHEKDLTTIKNDKRMQSISIVKAGEENRQDSYYLQKTIEIAKENHADGIFTFNSRKEILQFAKDNFGLISLPIFVSSFLTRSPNRFCLLADVGARQEWGSEEYLEAEKELQNLVKNGLLLSNPTSSLVSTSDNENDLPFAKKDAYQILSQQDGFLGITPISKLREGKADIYLTDGFLGRAIIDSFYSSYRLFADKFEAYKNDDFRAKLAFHMGNKRIKTIESQTSALLDATGNLLYGYDTLVLEANKEASLSGLVHSLEFLNQAIDSLPKEEK